MRADEPLKPCAICSPADPLVGRAVTGRTPEGLVFQARLEQRLAEGGIGVVYAARVLADGRPVAVKVLQERHAGDAGIAGRFAREITYAFRVSHPNLVTPLAAGHLDDGRPFLAMERLEGQTLGALVRAEGALDIARAIGLADQILAGLGALHEARIVHRDLQPDNIFVAPGPHGDRAVILDLGFAQEPGADQGDGVTPDSPGSLVGTLAFMAPEQATRGRAITARSDLFAVAVLLYHAVSGRLPFRGQDDRAVLVSVVRAAPIPLRRARRDAPAALDDVIARALAKHPDARFASALEMRAALARIVIRERALVERAPRSRRSARHAA
jgi:serine/threonine-protein kinase